MGVNTLRNKHQKGFTLIELLVVIAIIGLLASVVLLALNSARQKSRDAKRLADMHQISTAMELFYNSNNRYPTSAAAASLPSLLTPTFLGQYPTPPLPTSDGACGATTNYDYVVDANGTTYSVTFCLGADTGGYLSKSHTLTPAGIQ